MRLPRRGLRAGVIVAFASGALLISLMFAITTFLSTRHYLLDQRERSALRQAYNDAARVKAALLHGADVQRTLNAVHMSSHASVYVRVNGRWYGAARAADRRTTTRHVAPAVRRGSVAFSWTGMTKPPSSVVGIPLPAVDAEYYEILRAGKLQSTLTTIQATLAVCAALTTLAGLALGWFASRRVLVPLNDVADAAARIAAGELDTRLPATNDPDLATLVSSFNTMVDGVADRLEHDARFAANVSHELRTPVATLTTSLGVLQHDPDLSERSRTAVGIMNTELVRFRQALEDLIALERLDTDIGAVDLEVVPIADVVSHAARENHLAPDLIHLSPSDAGLEVNVNQLQIRRALSNLIRNAHAHGGGVTAVRIVRHDDRVEIHVEDHGPGVPEADRERVFERFTRLGARRSGSGSGLGLSIVERTAAVHGGTVECRPHHPQGADFVFSLPLAEESA